jgi:SAM-dependent methyltransferase
MRDTYNPRSCDLCGGVAADVVVSSTSGRIVRSDRVILAGHLSKLGCARCGLVRAGDQEFGADLASYYTDSYDPGAPDHLFYTLDGPVTRSSIFADWMISATGIDVWTGRPIVAEVGAGSGHLLSELSRRFPDGRFIAVEPGRDAAARTAALGFEVSRDVEGVLPGSCDVVVAAAVLEHVASPTRFLNSLRTRLRPGGTLILTQPTQDVASYDVLFADHLHHFGRAHLAGYARKCGFHEKRSQVGHWLMPNFSLHVWQAAERSNESWQGAPAATLSAASAARVMADLARLDTFLDRCAREGRRLATFGLHEAFAIALAYSGLGGFPLVCGLDDEPDKRGRFDFPVVRPEEAPAFGVTDALLTMNALHYPVATRRLDRSHIRSHPVLSA